MLKKRINHILREKAKKAKKFTFEFKKHTTTAITAAFAFLIALVWRDAISDFINNAIQNIVSQQLYLYKLIVAIIVTFLAVLGILIASRWGAKEASQ